jgi:Protein of unknown function (DUF3551)
MDMRLLPIAPTLPCVAALVVAGFVAAAMAGLPVRAEPQNFARYEIAQNYPWCLISSAYEGGQNCGFSTFDQCQASRLGIGGFCQINSQYRTGVAPAASPPYEPKVHRRS